MTDEAEPAASPRAAEKHSIGHRIEVLLGPYASFFDHKEGQLIFGGQQSSRGSVAIGIILIALGLIVYYLIFWQMSGWISRVFASLGGTILLYTGTFFLRYFHAVILDQDTNTIYRQTRRDKVAFGRFSDVMHFKQTDHKSRGRYRATTLNIVLKDQREVRILTFKKSRVSGDFPAEMNRLLWKWLSGHREA